MISTALLELENTNMVKVLAAQLNTINMSEYKIINKRLCLFTFFYSDTIANSIDETPE